MDQQTMVHLHNRILHSREKGAYTLCDSMDEPGHHYTNSNKPGGDGQYHMISPLTVT